MTHLRLLAAIAALGLAAGSADARPHRPAQVPNGSALGCALCHTNTFGGGARNAFGQMVEEGFLTSNDFNGDVIWGPELAALDADGDGATNGEELQDPDGTWSVGDPNPGDPEAVTLPFDASSFPPPAQPTAVTASSWGTIKATLRDLID